MNNVLLGEKVEVVAARDRTLVGLKGTVVLESMHTITLESAKLNQERRLLVMAKRGTAMRTLGASKIVILGDELEGRLEDRIAGGARL